MTWVLASCAGRGSSADLKGAFPKMVGRESVEWKRGVPDFEGISRRKMAPPFSFSNRLARWVARTCRSSIMSIELRPHADRVRTRWDEVHPFDGNSEEDARRNQLCNDRLYSTGFVIAEDADSVWLLTTVHMLENLYNAQNPLTPAIIENMFISSITCDHREIRHRSGEDPDRVTRRVFATEVSCARDLLLYWISRANLHMYCTTPHPPLFPYATKDGSHGVMAPSRYRTLVIGETSHGLREYRDVVRDNVYGYQMSFGEVNITSGKGSSGAPLMSGDVEVTGLLHGGDGFLSLFITLADIRDTLAEWGKEMYNLLSNCNALH
ncbi:hypothetical protein EJB05_33917, partial [Eragrostis curvula]